MVSARVSPPVGVESMEPTGRRFAPAVNGLAEGASPTRTAGDAPALHVSSTEPADATPAVSTEHDRTTVRLTPSGVAGVPARATAGCAPTTTTAAAKTIRRITPTRGCQNDAARAHDKRRSSPRRADRRKGLIINMFVARAAARSRCRSPARADASGRERHTCRVGAHRAARFSRETSPTAATSPRPARRGSRRCRPSPGCPRGWPSCGERRRHRTE